MPRAPFIVSNDHDRSARRSVMPRCFKWVESGGACHAWGRTGTSKFNYPGELVSVDTFFVGTLKGVGKVYMQGVLDCFSRYAWGRLYTSKLPLTAVQVMHNDVLPFFEEHGIRIHTVLSDNGREFCGRPDKHPYELFLQLEEIEHRTTRVSRPQSNGFIERFHRTLLHEHLRIAGRTKWYESVEEMQVDLDA